MPHDNDIFVNDDLNNSAENRLNHILFGLFLNDEFRKAILQRLGVIEDAIIYKPANVWGQARPDFAIESFACKTIGYIEVELDKDIGQLTRYKAHAKEEGLEVYSFGRSEDDHSITLKQLVDLAKDVLVEDENPQLDLMVRHLEKQVRESEGVRKSRPGPVQTQLETPLGEALLGAGMVNWGEERRGQPGKLYGRSNGPHGISVRVYSPKSGDNTVMVFHITAGRSEVNFAVYSHLEEYLPPDKLSALPEWADFIYGRLGADIRSIAAGQYRQVHISAVENNAADLVEWLFPLA